MSENQTICMNEQLARVILRLDFMICDGDISLHDLCGDIDMWKEWSALVYKAGLVHIRAKRNFE